MGRYSRMSLAAVMALAMAVSCHDAVLAADGPLVVVSIKPVHSLVASVMEGVGTPRLLIAGGGSPHSYALKPSDATALRNAKAAVRVSEQLENFLDKPIRTLARDAVIVTLADVDGMTILKPRQGGVWDGHERERKHGHEGARDAGDAQHGHGARGGVGDPHLWLDPMNAKVIVDHMAGVLASIDPANAERYRANGRATQARLDALDRDLAAATAPLKDKRYIVLHDAFQYFEHRYGLSAAGSITVSPERQPGAKRLAAVRDLVQALAATCVFAEPQFAPKLIDAVADGTGARTGTLDPLGAALAPGPELYFTVLRQLAKALAGCLMP